MVLTLSLFSPLSLLSRIVCMGVFFSVTAEDMVGKMLSCFFAVCAFASGNEEISKKGKFFFFFVEKVNSTLGKVSPMGIFLFDDNFPF